MATRQSTAAAINAGSAIGSASGSNQNLIADMVAIINQLSAAVDELNTAGGTPVTILPDDIEYRNGITPT